MEIGYPAEVVDRAIHNSLLQGPAPKPETKKEVIPLITTYSNYSQQNIVRQANKLIERCPDDTTKRSFENKKVIGAFWQPLNLQRLLTSAKFEEDQQKQKESGIFKCSDKKCKICKFYLQECREFKVENNVLWQVKSHLTCHSRNVIYFQRCNFCNKVSNIGKTNIFRKRTNNHISSCRRGSGTDIFDKHVFQCKKGKPDGPFFKIWIMMELDDFAKLLTYENHFHRLGYDTINRGKPE